MRDPKRYTLGTAAKATGKSKTTIQRAISKGLISANKVDGIGYSIDPSELHRVFPMIVSETVAATPQVDTAGPHEETVTLRVKLEAAEAMLAREREALEELRRERDAWRQQATALLASPQKSRSWWPWSRK